MEKMLNDCVNCGKDMPCQRPEPNVSHIFHGIMTFMTCGLWVIIWIICAMKAPDRDWKCTQCGEVVKVEKPMRWYHVILGLIILGILNIILLPLIL